MFKYDEDINMLVPVATEFDIENHCVYAKADSLGSYCVMDMEQWLAGFDVPREAYQTSRRVMVSGSS